MSAISRRSWSRPATRPCRRWSTSTARRYLTESIIAVGTDSVWNDNCEYDSLMDKDCTCDFDGKGGTIGQLKPLMSTLMCKVGADAVVDRGG